MGKYEQNILEIKDKIVKEFNPEKIILFGSYAWGKPTNDSDVDLFIVKKSKKPRIERTQEIRKFLWRDKVPMDLLVYTPEEVAKSINENQNLFIEDIVRNGKILYEKPGNAFTIMFPQRPLIVLH